MAIPPYKISMGDINEHLGRPRTQKISLDDPEVRALAGIPTGKISISDFAGIVNFGIPEPNIGGTGTWRTETLGYGTKGFVGVGAVGQHVNSSSANNSSGWSVGLIGDTKLAGQVVASAGAIFDPVYFRDVYIPDVLSGATNRVACRRENSGQLAVSLFLNHDGSWIASGSSPDYYPQLATIRKSINQGASWTTEIADLPNAKGRPSYLLCSTYHKSGERNFIVVTHLGWVFYTTDIADITKYEDLDILLWSTISGNHNVNQSCIYVSMKDRNNWAFSVQTTTHDNAGHNLRVWIMRDGVLFTDNIPLGVQNGMIWNQDDDSVSLVGGTGGTPNNVPKIWQWDAQNVRTLKVDSGLAPSNRQWRIFAGNSKGAIIGDQWHNLLGLGQHVGYPFKRYDASWNLVESGDIAVGHSNSLGSVVGDAYRLSGWYTGYYGEANQIVMYMGAGAPRLNIFTPDDPI